MSLTVPFGEFPTLLMIPQHVSSLLLRIEISVDWIPLTLLF